MWVWVYHVGVGIPCGCGYNMFHWQVELVNPIKWAAKLLLQVKNLLQFTWIAVNVSSKWYPAFDSSLCPLLKCREDLWGGRGAAGSWPDPFWGKDTGITISDDHHHHHHHHHHQRHHHHLVCSFLGQRHRETRILNLCHTKLLGAKVSVGNLVNIRWHHVIVKIFTQSLPGSWTQLG